MFGHMRANLALLILSVGIASVAYPLAVYAVGRGLFPARAAGSLVVGADGKPAGSRLVAQEFTGDEWFQPRPSAAGYNAAASSGSNLGASNPKLRDRAARQLGPVARYKGGRGDVQKDIEAWLAARPDRLAAWAAAHPAAAELWKADGANAKAIEAWTAANPGDVFATFAARHPAAFPVVESDALAPATTGAAVHAALFEAWLKDNPAKAAEVEPAPADAVSTSGSGLDPHVTLRNARAQAVRVAAAWAAKPGGDPAKAAAEVDAALAAAAFEPLLGLVGGEPLVNVLEVNLELARRFAAK